MTEPRTAETPCAVGIDIGGTNLRAALVAGDGMILRERRLATPAGDREALLQGCVDLHDAVTAEIEALRVPVGIGIASIVRDRRVAVHGPNLRIGPIDVVTALAERGLDRVVVENDANAAMFAEWQVGAVRGHEHALMVTIGTGVGGGAIIDGALLRGAHGFGGEAGHVNLVVDGRACSCGRHGCLEAYVAGSTFGATVAEREGDRPDSILHGSRDVDGRQVSEAAHAGDDLAIEVLEQVGRWLGIGLTSMVNLLDPSIVVIGGGAAADNGRWLLPAARTVLAEQIEGAEFREPPLLVEAKLGDGAGVVGAALLAAAQWPAAGAPDRPRTEQRSGT